jgi:hypothetical protein
MPYDDTLPTDMDKARAVLQDIDPANELLSDDHIEAVLGLFATFDAAVAFLADELAVRFAQKPGSVSLPSGLSVSWAFRVAEWRRIADNARKGLITGGGSSISQVSITYGTDSTDEFARPTSYWP